MCINLWNSLITRLRVLLEDVERNWIVFWLELTGTKARCEPSGDKLQKPSVSICGGPVVLLLFMSNGSVSRVFFFEVLYKQMVEGKRAHVTVKMAMSLRTSRGVPPCKGIAIMEEVV